MNEWHRIERNWRAVRYTAWVFITICTLMAVASTYASSVTANQSSIFFSPVWTLVSIPGFFVAAAIAVLALFMERRARGYAESLRDYQADMATQYQSERAGPTGAPRG